MNTPHALALGPAALFIAPRCAETYTPPSAPPASAASPHWRTPAEKMRLLDPCPELTLATERLDAAERLFRAALCLFGGCFGCLIITAIIAVFRLY